eukprot:GGOE01036207.1.p1 GENE.GGOE01036207.1~~GGOE01036207.1.p1  ORF type:complete len:150 (+),score=28.77 GGOE01036207.1:58-507(+)
MADSDDENNAEQTTRPLHVKDQLQYEQLVADPEKLVVLIFTAEWCEICREMQPRLVELVQQPEYDPVQFLDVDVNALPNVAEQFQLDSLPAFQYLLKTEPLFPGFSGSNLEKFKAILEKSHAKRNELMTEYDAAKAAREEANMAEGEED